MRPADHFVGYMHLSLDGAVLLDDGGAAASEILPLIETNLGVFSLL